MTSCTLQVSKICHAFCTCAGNLHCIEFCEKKQQTVEDSTTNHAGGDNNSATTLQDSAQNAKNKALLAEHQQTTSSSKQEPGANSNSGLSSLSSSFLTVAGSVCFLLPYSVKQQLGLVGGVGTTATGAGSSSSATTKHQAKPPTYEARSMYDINLYHNLKTVMGNNPFLWLLPIDGGLVSKKKTASV